MGDTVCTWKTVCLLHFGDLTPKIIDILSVQASNSKEEYKTNKQINKQTNKQKTRKKQQIIKIKYLISINNKKWVCVIW